MSSHTNYFLYFMLHTFSAFEITRKFIETTEIKKSAKTCAGMEKTMHIALCVDDVADRKQLERLLKRETNNRTSDGSIFYVDSFGTPEALYTNLIQYDLFYIDVTLTKHHSAMDIVQELIQKGIHSLIVLCGSFDELQTQDIPNNVCLLNKPIKADQLSASIDLAITKRGVVIPPIELRSDLDTFFIAEENFMYAVEDKRKSIVTTTDGKRIPILSTAMNLFDQLEQYPSLFAPSRRYIINARHIQKIGFQSVTMKDGTKFNVSLRYMPYAKYAYEEFHSS